MHHGDWVALFWFLQLKARVILLVMDDLRLDADRLGVNADRLQIARQVHLVRGGAGGLISGIIPAAGCKKQCRHAEQGAQQQNECFTTDFHNNFPFGFI